jgi:hypothetical protein
VEYIDQPKPPDTWYQVKMVSGQKTTKYNDERVIEEKKTPKLKIGFLRHTFHIFPDKGEY